ncbi:hypothetical protein [Lentilitoribacter sp. EG35]|uniref:hypothetical protein n=1 Tax=Lentilitoribacter sp. EG35 TaxID=3234192 RepID=UPI00345F66DF
MLNDTPYEYLTNSENERMYVVHVRNGRVRIRTLNNSWRSYRASTRYFCIWNLSRYLWGEHLGRASGPIRVAVRLVLGSSNLLVHPANFSFDPKIGDNSQRFNMNYNTIEFNQGYLRKIELDTTTWYHAHDACDLLGVVNNGAAIDEVPHDHKLMVNGDVLVTIDGFELINAIGQSDRRALSLLWLNPIPAVMEVS